jgi:hypothetical protein
MSRRRTGADRPTSAARRLGRSAVLGTALTAAVLAASSHAAEAAGRFDYHVDLTRGVTLDGWRQGSGSVILQAACPGPSGYKFTMHLRRKTTWTFDERGSKVFTCTNRIQQYTFENQPAGNTYYAYIDKANDGRQIHVSGNIFYP